LREASIMLPSTRRANVAHTANNAVDVLDPSCRSYLFSVRHLPGVAGVLVSDEAQIIITANRGENTIGIFSPAPEPQVSKVAVGVRPNGLAYDHARRQILVAKFGDPALPGSHTLTIVGLLERAVRAPRATGRQSIRPFTSEHCANSRPTA